MDFSSNYIKSIGDRLSLYGESLDQPFWDAIGEFAESKLPNTTIDKDRTVLRNNSLKAIPCFILGQFVHGASRFVRLFDKPFYYNQNNCSEEQQEKVFKIYSQNILGVPRHYKCRYAIPNNSKKLSCLMVENNCDSNFSTEVNNRGDFRKSENNEAIKNKFGFVAYNFGEWFGGPGADYAIVSKDVPKSVNFIDFDKKPIVIKQISSLINFGLYFLNKYNVVNRFKSDSKIVSRQMLVTEHEKAGKLIYVFGVHLSPTDNPENPTQEEIDYHSWQLDRIVEEIRKIIKEKGPNTDVFLCGDLNINSFEFDKHKQLKLFKNTYDGDNTWHDHDVRKEKKDLEKSQIFDYILKWVGEGGDLKPDETLTVDMVETYDKNGKPIFTDHKGLKGTYSWGHEKKE